MTPAQIETARAIRDGIDSLDGLAVSYGDDKGSQTRRNFYALHEQGLAYVTASGRIGLTYAGELVLSGYQRAAQVLAMRRSRPCPPDPPDIAPPPEVKAPKHGEPVDGVPKRAYSVPRPVSGMVVAFDEAGNFVGYREAVAGE